MCRWVGRWIAHGQKGFKGISYRLGTGLGKKDKAEVCLCGLLWANLHLWADQVPGLRADLQAEGKQTKGSLRANWQKDSRRPQTGLSRPQANLTQTSEQTVKQTSQAKRTKKFEFVRAQTAQSGQRDLQTNTVTRGVLEPKLLLPRAHMLLKKFLKKEQMERFASQNA